MHASSHNDEIFSYDPHKLLDALCSTLQLKNDAQLARVLEVNAPLISKIRHRKLKMGAGILIRMHEVTGLGIVELRALMGDRRDKLRIGKVRGRRIIA